MSCTQNWICYRLHNAVARRLSPRLARLPKRLKLLRGKVLVPLDIPDFNGELRLMAVAWTAGKWWLGRAGSPLGAAAVGVAVAGAALAGGPAARAVLAVLWAAHRLLAATAALGDGAKALDRV